MCFPSAVFGKQHRAPFFRRYGISIVGLVHAHARAALEKVAETVRAFTACRLAGLSARVHDGSAASWCQWPIRRRTRFPQTMNEKGRRVQLIDWDRRILEV